MRAAIVRAIVRKELRETLRDRRTLILLVVLPMLLYPLMAITLSKLEGRENDAREARASRVALWSAAGAAPLTGSAPPRPAPAAIEAAAASAGKLTLEPWRAAPDEVRRDLEAGAITPARPTEVEDEASPSRRAPPWSEPENPVLTAARAAVSKREVDAILVLWPGFEAALAEGREGAASIYYDSVRPDSRLARDRLARALRAARRAALADREATRALPAGFTRAVEVMSRDVAPPSRTTGQILGTVMPMLLILMALLGGFLPAIDLTAGEKERGTMATLLCAPIRPIEIIAGKFLTVATVALVAGLVNLVSVSFTLRRILPGELTLSPSVYGLVLVLLLPIVALFSAIFLAVAVFAKDFKDGQNLLTPVYLPITLLTGLPMLPGFELDAVTALLPILNVALLVKALFLGEAASGLIFATLASSAAYAALALVFAARVFEREDVLLGSKGSFGALFRVERRGGEPTPGFALGAFAVTLVLTFYGSLLIERAGMAAQLLVVEIGLLLAPLAAMIAIFGFSPRDTLALRAPSARGLLGAALLGCSAWALIVLLVRFFPPPRELTEQLARLGEAGSSLPLTLLLVAVLPAVCEELFFRGLVFSGLRRAGPVAAVLVSALLFAIVHGSFYRLLPTFSLGVVLGVIRYRTQSIVPGMLFHALNNGIAITIVVRAQAAFGGALATGELPLWVTGAAAIIFTAGIFTLPRRAAA